MVQLVVVEAVAVGEELRQLVVAVGRVVIVLNLEVGVAEQGECRAVARRKLQLTREDLNDLLVFLITNERVNRLGVLAVRDSSKLVFHKFEFE